MNSFACTCATQSTCEDWTIHLTREKCGIEKAIGSAYISRTSKGGTRCAADTSSPRASGPHQCHRLLATMPDAGQHRHCCWGQHHCRCHPGPDAAHA
eukprot:8559676-Lingulodinium_polyedra.AAC.1